MRIGLTFVVYKTTVLPLNYPTSVRGYQPRKEIFSMNELV